MDLVSKRLILREFQEADFEAVHKYASDPEVCRYSDWGPNTIEDTQRFMEDVVLEQTRDPRNNFTLAVVIRGSSELIGACSLTRTEPNEGEIGFTLNRDYWGHGFATEAAQAMLMFAFTGLSMHRVFATCRPSNIGSSRVLEKIGMRKEGHLRDHRYFKGQWQDSFLYAMVRSDLQTKDS